MIYRILTKKVGYLYVGGLETPFSQIKLNQELKTYDNKIIECTFEDNQWKCLRQRTDKSFPNSYKTALGKCLLCQCFVTFYYRTINLEYFSFLLHISSGV